MLPLAVLLAGLVATALLVASLLERQRAEQAAAMVRSVEVFREALVGRVLSYADTLPALRVIAGLQQFPNDAEFARYADAIAGQTRFAAIAQLFLADRVAGSARDAFVAAVRADRSVQPAGRPEFDITPPAPRDEYLVVRHAFPPERASVGYDLYDPQRNYRPAIDAAVDSGSVVATGPLLLARDRDLPDPRGHASVVIRAAVYQGGVVPATRDERRAKLAGVVGVSFGVETAVRSVLPPRLAQGARVRIIDRDAERAGQAALLFDSGDALPAAGTAAPGLRAAAGPGSHAFEVELAQRVWVVQVQPHASGLVLDTPALWLLLLGSASAVLLALRVRTLARKHGQAEQQVQQGTQALQAERERLHDSESRYRLLFEHSFDAVLRARPDGRILAANPAACRLFGHSEATLQAIGRAGLIDAQDPRSAQLVAMREAHGSSRGPLRMQHADGHFFEAELSACDFTDSDGAQVTCVVIRDISARAALDARLREAQNLASIGTLAGGIAHDFNNVLAVILGNVELASHALPPGHAVLPALQRIDSAAERARKLVHQILTFSRRSTVQRSPQPLHTLVADTVAMLRSSLPTSTRLVLEPTTQPLSVLGDAAQLQQVVLNLCTNASQALAGAPGTVALALDVLQLDATSAAAAGLPAGAYARLRVSDDGPGMADAVRAQVFEPFFTTKPVGQGSGLGLSVVHGIAIAAGGTVRVEARPGAGTTFTLLLPLCPPDAAPAPVPSPPAALAPMLPAAPADHRHHLLLVDDDEIVGITATAVLERAGHRVTMVLSGHDALASLRQQPGHYELVITDHNMPVMSGLELARTLQAEAPGLPVVILTGDVTDALQQQAAAAGVQAVLAKEFVLDRLDRLVSTLLDRRALPAD